MSRTIIIGDVHGCLYEVQDLLAKVAFVPGTDRLVFVGDLVDRGPQQIGALRFAIGIGADVVLGNHEDKYLRYHRWKQLQKAKKLKPGHHQPSMKPEMLALYDQLEEDDFAAMELWPRILPLGDFDGEDFVVVHAGVETNRTIAQQRPENVIRTRWVDKDGDAIPSNPDLTRPDGGIRWTYRWRGPESIVYGHAVRGFDHPTIEGTPLSKVGWRAYGIDTGCVYGGKLTALVLPGREIVQVDAKTAWVSSPYALDSD
jgi:hypothetical protein